MAATGAVDVQARIAEIKARFEPTSTPVASSSFADTLQGVLGVHNDATSSTSSNSSVYGAAATGDDVIDAAKKYLGVPYVWGGTSDTGLDCSGLVQKAFGDIGIDMPRVASDQARMGTPVASLAQAKPGDLVAFGSPVDHIGIYVGDNKMIVAPKRGDVVKIQEIYKTPTAIRRIDMSEADGANATSSLLQTASSSSSSSAIPASLHSKYDSLFVQAGAKNGVSPALLAAVAKQESGFNASAKSGAGAQGLMQLMPGTADGLGVNAMDPTQAVDGAARMLKGLIQKFGSVELALAGYNAGPNAVTRYGGIPPYAETQRYVKNVIAMTKTGATS